LAPPVRLVPDLTLNPTFAASWPGWSMLTCHGKVVNLSAGLPSGSDDGLFRACGALANALRNPMTDPQAAAPSFVNALSPDAWDKLYGLLREGGPSLWRDIPSLRRNIVTGQPASEGKIDPSGRALPTDPTSVIAGFGLPSPGISLGKRFGFSTNLDVHLYLYLDKDAYAQQMRDFVSGGGLGFEGKTSAGTPLKLRLGVGRDQAGGGAGFIRLQIGPDYVAMPPAP
jgi:hypothetical protein